VYRVEDDILYVTVISVGKRDRLKVYKKARHRMPPNNHQKMSSAFIDVLEKRNIDVL